jgi:spore germination cell wall hydrolase CwlJ-like protein
MSFYDNPNVTYNKWINWYHGVPETPPADDTTDEDATDDQAPADPIDVDFGQQETDVGGMDPAQEARVSASIMRIGDQRINGVVTKKGKNFAAIDFGTVKYASLDDYLKAEQLGDRSGRFSGVEFPNKAERDKTLERGAQIGAALDPTGLMLSAIPFASTFDSQVIQDPTGQFSRAIPKSGVFNPIATMAIAEEYRELYALKDFRTKNPGVTGKEGGFAFNFGNVNIWRRPGEVLYRGQLDRAGLNQQTATSYEQFINGASQGKQVVSAMLTSSGGDGSGAADIINNVAPDARLVLQTENGGYLLNGNFHYGSGIARYGFDEDMKALAASVFSAGGKLSAQESYSIAQKWRSSAHGLDRNATAAEKLANLQTFIDAATTLNQNNEAAAAAAAAAQAAKEAAAAQAQAAIEQQRLDDIAAARRNMSYTDPNYYDDSDESGPSLSSTPSGGDRDDSGREYGTESAFDNVDDNEGLDPDDYAEGGDIPEEEGFVRGSPDTEQPMITGNELLEAAGDESGFVERPPSEVSDEKSVADDKPMVAKEEGMVLNAEAVKLAGEQDVAKMIKDAEDYVRGSGEEAADDREATDIQISEGEVYISPQLADVIGRDRLRKINDRGIPKTEKKLQKAAKGGKIKGYQSGGDVGDDGAYDAIVAAQERFADRFPGDTNQERVENARIEAQRIMQGLNAEDAMAITMIGEASILGDDGMEAVGHVINNRANSMYREYADQPTPVDVITRRLPGRDYQFNALEFRTLRRTLNDITSSEYGRRKFEEMRSIAAEIISGDREDITGGALLFWNPTTSTNQHIRDGLNDGTYEVAYTQGQGNRAHQFIRPVGTELAQNTAASEFPDVESGFMTPEPAPAAAIPEAASTMAPPAPLPSGPVQFNPERQDVGQNLDIQGLRNEPDTSFMTMNR